MQLEYLGLTGAEPITLEQAKSHLRVSIDDDDASIETLISVARRVCESRLKRAIVSQEFRLSLDCLPIQLTLPNPPLVSVESITYLDSSNTRQTLSEASYEVLAGTPGIVQRVYGGSYPSVLHRPGSVQVEYTAGYGVPPEPIIQAMLLVIGLLYDYRAAATPERLIDLPIGIEYLLGTEAYGGYF